MRPALSKRGFTLAELIMAVALLAVFSMFIVQMFAKADTLARSARALDQAVACASNLADQWRTDRIDQATPELLDLSQNPADGRAASLSLDAHFQICPPEQAYYLAVLSLKALDDGNGEANEGSLWQLCVVIGKVQPSDSPPIYRLRTSRYDPAEEVLP